MYINLSGEDFSAVLTLLDWQSTLPSYSVQGLNLVFASFPGTEVFRLKSLQSPGGEWVSCPFSNSRWLLHWIRVVWAIDMSICIPVAANNSLELIEGPVCWELSVGSTPYSLECLYCGGLFSQASCPDKIFLMSTWQRTVEMGCKGFANVPCFAGFLGH